MRNKSIFILILIAAATFLIAYFMLFQPEHVIDPNTGWETDETVTIFSRLSEAKKKYDELNKIDYDEQEQLYNQLGSQLSFVNDEIKVLKAQIKNVESEHALKENQLRQEKTEELNKKAMELREKIIELEQKLQFESENAPERDEHLISSTDLIYSLLLDGVENTTAEVVMFIGDGGDQGLYTVKLVGYIDSLSEALKNITDNMESYDISIGHCSFRQVYACYNNMRPWDRITLLNWFDNNYVTGSGGMGSVSGGYVVDGIKVSGILGDDTIEILENAKIRDVETVKLECQEMLDKIEKERIDAIIAAYRGVDQNKVNALIAALNEHYDNRIVETKAERDARIEFITNEYDQRINALKNPTVEGDTSIANPDLLIYTLDITFSVYDE